MPACRAGVVERGRVVVAAELRGKVDVSAPPVQPLSWKVQRPASIWMRCCLSLAHAADFVPFALAFGVPSARVGPVAEGQRPRGLGFAVGS